MAKFIEWEKLPEKKPLTTRTFFHSKRLRAEYLEKIRRKNLEMQDPPQDNYCFSEYCPASIPHANKIKWHKSIEEDCGGIKGKQHAFHLDGSMDCGYRFLCNECPKTLSINISNQLAYEMVCEINKQIALRINPSGIKTEGLNIKSPEKVKKEKEEKRQEQLKSLHGHNRVMLTRVVSQTEYIRYMNSPEWKIKRKAILQWHDYTCSLCGFRSRKITEVFVHHSNYERLGNEKPEDMLPICSHCHKLFHFGVLPLNH